MFRPGSRACALVPALMLSLLGLGTATARAVDGLPDDRGYEVVSPSAKNGADIAGSPTRTRAAADGNAVQFLSLGAFGDARGTSVATEYMSIRTLQHGTSGWTTHAITPGNLEPGTPIDAIVVFLEPRYVGEFSPDLDWGVFLSSSPLTQDSPNTSAVPNLYVRTDLRAPGDGTYRLLTACPGCSGALPANPSAKPFLAAASADFNHIIFESQEPLTSDTISCTPTFFDVVCPLHLYEWANGTVRLAGVLPASEGGAAAPNSQAGRGASSATDYTPNTISADGSRIIFTVNTGGDADAGRLYMRVDGTSTVQINASERTAPDAVPADATYRAASDDGSKIFFTTKENLVDGDNTAENNADLYIYNFDAAVGHRLSLVSSDGAGVGAQVDGVIGATPDGATIYFVASNQLVAGQPNSSGYRIFRWHAGVVHYVAKISDAAFDRTVSAFGGWHSGPQTARITPDGNKLLFVSQGTDELPHSPAGDACADGCFEVFIYDAEANSGNGSVACASCAQPDAPATSNASFSSSVVKGTSALTSHLNHPLSSDGRYVFFQTGAALVSGDQNGGTSDVYEYDAQIGRSRLLSTGKPGSFGAYFVDASANGSDAFFVTRDKLSPWDVDDNVDLYDARMGGGVPTPTIARPECGSDTCRPVPTAAGGTATVPAGSSVFKGRGNAASHKHAKRRCARGKVRRRVHGKTRCVRRAHHKARHAATSAGHTHVERKGQ